MTADDPKKGESLLDNLKEQASGLTEKGKDLIVEHGDKIEGAIDKAAGLLDEKTKGKHADKIGTAADKAKDLLDKLGGSGPADEGPPSKTTP